MFESDVVAWDTAETLAASARAQADEHEAGIQRLLLAVHYADLHPDPAMIPADQSCPGAERALHPGGPGCPGIAEFAVAEYGVVLGLSIETAAKTLGQALALRHRLPLIWDRVLAREAIPWRAREAATASMHLSVDAAAIVDTRVAPIINTVGPIQLRNIIKAALWEADPETAKAAAEQKARERGVYLGRSDDHGTSTIVVKADTGSVIFFDATIDQMADALNNLEGPAPRQAQRARAFSIMADPSLSHLFLQVAQYLATHQPTTTPEPAESTTNPADAPTSTSDTAGCSTPNTMRAEESAASSTGATDLGPRDLSASIHNPSDRLHGQAVSELASTTRTEPAEAMPAEMPCQAEEPCWLDEPGMNTEPDGNRLRRPRVEPLDPTMADTLITAMDAAARDNLAAKLFALKTAAHKAGIPATRPGKIKLYVHLTDETLLAGQGTMRIERFGPVYAKLAELVGYDRVVVQPVIDLNEGYNVNAYEIPGWMRERVKLTYPVEQFPYGPGETTNRTDLDHVIPYDPNGPAGQTSTTNLRPLRRRSHRIKTFAGWTEHTNGNATEWTTPHGYRFRVDHNGTHPIHDDG
ncbi:HNH endonuclease signature motif containing protein [Kribbella ginsengisoli]|uniref:DUF222 domain-containing protein n=1 Tax=Kribbella ginsengisoli TaxID=363865 RepID=A0ABP6YC69_9ACTN